MPDEAELYRQVTGLVKQHLRDASKAGPKDKEDDTAKPKRGLSRIALLALQIKALVSIRRSKISGQGWRWSMESSMSRGHRIAIGGRTMVG